MNNQSGKDLAKEFSEFCINKAKQVKTNSESTHLVKAVLPAVFGLLVVNQGGYWDSQD